MNIDLIDSTVALLAATLAYLGLVLTKEQKVSDFRQAWIDALRKDLSSFYSNVTQFKLSYELYDKSLAFWLLNFMRDNSEVYSHALSLGQQIKFRLNPNDEEGLIELINSILEILKDPTRQNIVQLDDLLLQLDVAGHNVFKNEWERVKTGAPWFYRSKWAAIVIFVLIVLSLMM